LDQAEAVEVLYFSDSFANAPSLPKTFGDERVRQGVSGGDRNATQLESLLSAPVYGCSGSSHTEISQII
jgi:hypothetical protein